MLPTDYHQRACKLLRLAAARLQQESLTTKEQTVNDPTRSAHQQPPTGEQPITAIFVLAEYVLFRDAAIVEAGN